MTPTAFPLPQRTHFTSIRHNTKNGELADARIFVLELSPVCIPSSISVESMSFNIDDKERLSSATPTGDSFTTPPPELAFQAGDPTLVGASQLEEKTTMAAKVKGFFKKRQRGHKLHRQRHTFSI
jgi:hypothetical protein